MAHWAFTVNLILDLILSDYRGPIYMGSNMTPWVLQNIVIQNVICLEKTFVLHRLILWNVFLKHDECIAIDISPEL